VERFRTPGGSDFFFLLGFAQTRTVPLNWIWLGVILTVLESWNAGWTWVAPNILFSLIRIARPYVQIFAQHQWAAFVLLVSALFAVLPIASKIVDYGAEGWLWALFGLYQRMYVDGRSASNVGGATPSPAPSAQAMTENVSQTRLWPALSPWSFTSGRNKGNSRFLRSISRSSFLASAFCPLACVCSCAARAASNRQNP
jgi:hypothetical protein